MKRMMFAALLGTTAILPAAALAQAQPQPQPNQAAPANQMRPVAASQLQGMNVYSPRGEEIGEVERVILGQGDQAYAVVAFGGFLGIGEESRLIPLSNLTMMGDRITTRGLRNPDYRNLTVYRDGLPGYRVAEPNYQARLVVQTAEAQPQQQADGSRIVVQQPAPTVRVDQASPQVLVQQPQPSVTVNQAQPQITVRQPQPTVTVDIPQPEIIVRMPQPDVNVAMAQPQVQVRQAQPQVQVVRPEPPQVAVERAQAQVRVQPPAGEPQVQVMRQAGQPEVRYERAEPKVVVNQAQGQPNVRFERMEGQAQQPAQAAQAREPAATGAVANPPVRNVRIVDLENMDVYNGRGEKLGEVKRLVRNAANNERFVILEHGGFLGLGEKEVPLALDRMTMRGDRLIFRGMTEAELRRLPDWDMNNREFREYGDNETIDLGVAG